MKMQGADLPHMLLGAGIKEGEEYKLLQPFWKVIV